MIEAFVLVQTEIGKAAQVVSDLRAIHGVSSAEAIASPYDAIARIGADDVDSLGKLVVGKIQAVDGVTRTLTCPVVVF